MNVCKGKVGPVIWIWMNFCIFVLNQEAKGILMIFKAEVHAILFVCVLRPLNSEVI